MESDTNATGTVDFQPGPTDSTVNFSYFEYVDPILDAIFRYKGRTSKRRYHNIIRMRARKIYGVDVRGIELLIAEQHALLALEPGYSLSHDGKLVDVSPTETDPRTQFSD